ncbi:MAG: TolC family protein, partial [Gemmatimonadaceae bacterium]
MLRRTFPAVRAALFGCAASLGPTVGASAQAVDSLVARAVAVNPAIHAAAARAEAARRRVQPAGLLPDPMLMLGIQNLPLGGEPGMSGPDPMTMRMVGVGQTLPYPGKLAARKRVAARELEAAEAAVAVATQQVVQDVRSAYYELAFVDRALDVVERSRRVLGEFITAAEARHGVGSAGQEDVLKARLEATRLAETAVALSEQRRAVLARLNALLDRPSDTPVSDARVPDRLARAAVAPSADQIRFVSAAFGARAADSPLPPLGELQETAVRESPMLREQSAMIAVQQARVDLAGREYLPDFELSLQYGQRPGRPDMVSATVSIPLPVYKGRKQDTHAAEARSQLAALQADLRARENEVRAEVARLYSELERQRAQLALYVKAIIPQGRASLASAAASYQVGRVEFLTVLENQAT